MSADRQDDFKARLAAHERFAQNVRRALQGEEWSDDFEASVLGAFNTLNSELKSLGGKWYANV